MGNEEGRRREISKYRSYKKDLELTESESRKCDCPFKLGKLMKGGK